MLALCLPRLSSRGTAVKGLVRAQPGIAIIPLVVLAALVALGCGLIYMGCRITEDSSRHETAAVAAALAADVQHAIEAAELPLQQVAALVDTNPDWTFIMTATGVGWPAFMHAAPKGTQSITLMPLGQVAGSTPDLDSALAAYGPDVLGSSNPGGRFSRQEALALLQHDTAWDTEHCSMLLFHGGMLDVVCALYGYANATNETWGNPYGAAAIMPDGVPIYDAARQRKWWGFVTLEIELASFELLREASTQINGYKDLQVEVRRPAQHWSTDMVTFDLLSTGVHSSDSYYLQIQLGDEYWEVYLWREWVPAWMERGLYAVVVIGATLIAILVFIVLISWAEHRALLHSLLPKQAIERMREEANWGSMDAHAEAAQVFMDTPAKMMLQIISSVMLRQEPRVQLLVAVRDALQHSADVYKPTLEQLRGRMEESEFVDAEVRQALVAQLVGPERMLSSPERATGPVAGNAAGAGGDVGQAGPWHPHEHPVPRRTPQRNVSLAAIVPEPAGGACTGLTGTHASLATAAELDTDDAGELGVQEVLLHILSAGIKPAQVVPADAAPASSPRIAAVVPAEATAGGEVTARQPCQQPAQLAREDTADLMVCATAASGHEGRTGTIEEEWALLKSKGSGPPPPAVLLTQLEQVLATSDQWAFDAYALEAASNGRPLSVMGYWLLHTTGLLQWACMEPLKLVRFLQQVENAYPSNPYHNRRHAANVLQSMHVILHRGGLTPGYADQLTLLACYLSAIVHDVEHRGRNNDYLVNAHDDLAVRYNDKSPMENHHVAAAFSLLKQPELNCLEGLGKTNWLKLRKLVIDLVLATDMKAHFATLGQFDALVRMDTASIPSRSSMDKMTQSRRLRVSASFKTNEGSECATGSGPTSSQSPRAHQHQHHVHFQALVPESDTDRLLSLQMALKCADVGHLTSPLATHLLWVSALEEEFFLQGDEERAKSLTISPLCDRTKEGVTKSQVGFFDFVAVPLFKSFCGRFVGCKPLYAALMDNYAFWASNAKVITGAPEGTRAVRASVVSRGSTTRSSGVTHASSNRSSAAASAAAASAASGSLAHGAASVQHLSSGRSSGADSSVA